MPGISQKVQTLQSFNLWHHVSFITIKNVNLIECLEIFKKVFYHNTGLKAFILGFLCLVSLPAHAQSQSETSAPAVVATPVEIVSEAKPEEVVQEEEEPSTPALVPAPAPAPAPALPVSEGALVETSSPDEPPQKPTAVNLKTVRDDQYNKPIYFEALDHLLPTTELEYDLSLKEGKALRVGDITIDEQSFFFAMSPTHRFHPKIRSVVEPEVADRVMLVIRWPEDLLPGGTLELISRTGAVLWKGEITDEKRQAWKNNLELWKKGLAKQGVKVSRLPKNSVFSTQYGFDIAEAKLRPTNESFRFCLTHAEGRARSRLCSQRYTIRLSGKTWALKKIKTDVTPRVLLQSEAAPLQQTVPVPRDKPTVFFAEMAKGEIYEFVATPNKLNLMDLTDSKKPDEIRIVAWGTRPTIPSVILNPDTYSALTRLLGFEPTIGDMRKFWEVHIPIKDPKLYLPGQGGGIFAQRFDLSHVPDASVRPYLEFRTPTGTYVDGVKLFGKKDPKVKINSLERSMEVDQENPGLFLWRFKATQRGEINRGYLSMSHGGNEYKAFYEVYKGFPRELSLRLSGLVSPTGENVFMGEAAYNHWFEDFFGWTNYWVGRQRWGLSAKYFKSLTKLRVSSSNSVELSVFNADLKYRFTPGLWGRDETVGMMLDYQSLKFGEIQAPMVGVGAFWARSMPKVFDKMINIIPLMRYEKWVDMEFIYYPMSLKPTVTLQNNFALNFHGKVLWTKHWFGEAGFGIKRYAIVDTVLRQKGGLNTFYGTVGLGLNF